MEVKLEDAFYERGKHNHKNEKDVNRIKEENSQKKLQPNESLHKDDVIKVKSEGKEDIGWPVQLAGDGWLPPCPLRHLCPGGGQPLVKVSKNNDNW